MSAPSARRLRPPPATVVLLGVALLVPSVQPPGTGGSALAGQDRDVATEERWEATKLEVSRERLEEIQAELRERLSAGGLSKEERARTNFQLTVIEDRLANGDFQSGDHVFLSVEGEPALTDTFTVATGPMLALPAVGDVDLHGILASELDAYLTRCIGEVLRQPMVRARALIQLSVLGEVTRPGFYLVTPDALLTEALMHAGGPTREASIAEIRIERGPASSWGPESFGGLPEAPLEALSANDLGLRTGDRIVVPEREGEGISASMLAQFAVLGLSAVVSLTQIFR